MELRYLPIMLLIVLLLPVLPVMAKDSFSSVQDPTRPDNRTYSSVPAKKKLVPLVLSSTMMGPANRRAIINGVSVREGKKIEGARIISIRSHSVVVKRNGRKEVLRFQVPNIEKQERLTSSSETKQGLQNATASK